MSLIPTDIGSMDVRLNIYEKARGSNAQGERSRGVGPCIYPNVWGAELRASADEAYEGPQETGIIKRAWRIRKGGKTINQTMFVEDVNFPDQYYSVVGTHPFKGDRDLMVVEAELR